MSVARHGSLAPFSREHVYALGHAQELLKAAEGSKADRKLTLVTFLQAWAERISTHFAQEERLLRPLLTPVEGIMFVYMQDQLRILAVEGKERSRRTDPGADWIRGFGQKLQNHVRWEESHLMALIEKTCSASQLAALGVESKQM